MLLRPLTPIEARVLGTLMEKARTVPDSYPLTLNSLVAGCNQKTSREPLMTVSDRQAQEALDSLRLLSLVFESSGSRVARWEHNFQRAVGVPEQSAVLLGLLMLRGPQTAGELRINTERWYRREFGVDRYSSLHENRINGSISGPVFTNELKYFASA